MKSESPLPEEPRANRLLATAGVEQRILDLLADGELSLAEERTLRSRLDESPAGWRQCALTLWEARTLRKELKGFDFSDAFAEAVVVASAAEIPLPDPAHVEAAAKIETAMSESGPQAATLVCDPQPVALPADALAAHDSAGGLTWSHVLSLAALLLLSFGLGTIVEFVPDRTATKAPRMTWTDRTDAGQASPRVAPGPGNQFVEYVTIPAEVSGRDAVNLPLLAGPGSAAFLYARPNSVPQPLREALEQSGHEIHEDQGWYPVRLPDGRQALIPIQQIEVRPTAPQHFE